MKLTCLAVAIFAIAPLVRAQDVPPKVEPPPDVAAQNARAQEEKARAVQQADEAVRRTAQNQQNSGGFGGGGGVMRYTPQRLNAKPIKGAWLGLTTSAPPAALRRQLKLLDGTGLVVDFVQPKSPADQGGLKQYDLLTQLNDQILINSEQLAVLVRTFKPRDEIKLTFFREGERQTQSVTLEEHDLLPLEEMQIQFFDGIGGRNNALPPRVLPDGAQGAGGGGGFGGGAGGFGGGGFGGGGPQSAPTYVNQSEHSITWMDGRQQITVNLDKDRKVVTVTDNRSKKVLYEGPIDDTDQQKSLPREARSAIERVKAFLKSNPNSADRDPAARPGTN